MVRRLLRAGVLGRWVRDARLLETRRAHGLGESTEAKLLELRLAWWDLLLEAIG